MIANPAISAGWFPGSGTGNQGRSGLFRTDYVGRTESGKMCYTFFDRDGKVSHINDNTAVYPFRPGFVLRRLTDKDPQWDEKKGRYNGQ